MKTSLPDDSELLRRVPQISNITLADIPPEIGLFPLSGAVLLPRGKLPLNVFEPRYIALIEDSLASHRLIGIIQPVLNVESEVFKNALTPLYKTGCIGRLTSFTERSNGTFSIILDGVIRFRVLRETNLYRGYRQARIDTSCFTSDLNELPFAPFDRQKLLLALRRYFEQKEIEAQWSVIEKIPDDALLIALPMLCPFPSTEKQALLEAPTLTERVHVLQAILDQNGPENNGPLS